MKSILKLIINTEYKINGKLISSIFSCNPNPKIAKLILKNPDYNSISSNPNIGLTKFIIDSRGRLNPIKLALNTNPLLAELIISFGYQPGLCSNPNPGLTKFIIENKDKLDYDLLSANTNCELAYLIMEKPNWYYVSKNPNTGLTKFIIDNEDKLDYNALSRNTNELLADLIIKNKHKINLYLVMGNSNPGLTNFILENHHNISSYLGGNSNPKLTDILINLPTVSVDINNKKVFRHHFANSSYLTIQENPHSVVINNSIYDELSKLAVQDALWFIMEKTSFYDFNFTDEFLKMIKIDSYYNGLYEVIELRIHKKFNIMKNKQEKIKIINSYKLIQLVIDLYTNWSWVEEQCDDELKILKILYDDVNINIGGSHTNILLFLILVIEQKHKLQHKYNNHPITQRYIDFVKLQNLINTRNIELTRKELELFKSKYPGKIDNFSEFAIRSTYPDDIHNVANRVELLFSSQFQLYKDIVCFIETCACLQRLRASKKYEYISYELKAPNYENYKDLFEHNIKIFKLTFKADMTNDYTDYYVYLKSLLESENKFTKKHTIMNCIMLLGNMQNYSEIYYIYNKNKDYILEKLRGINDIATKLNLIIVLLKGCVFTNRTILTNELIKIVPLDLGKYTNIKNIADQIFKFVDLLKKREHKINSMGYSIVCKANETCLICLEDIKDDDIELIKCSYCKKELGHVNCVYEWVNEGKVCPNCRSTDIQRKSIKTIEGKN